MNSWTKYILISIGLLLLEFGLVDLNVKQAMDQNHMAGIAYVFIPWIHSILTGVLALVLYGIGHKPLAKLFGITSLLILLIGLSICGGLLLFE